MRNHLLLALFVIIVSLSFSSPGYCQSPTVINLKHRQAEEIIQAIQPFVVPNGSVKAFNNQLIIQTTPQNLVEIQTLIEKLDQAIAQLIVTVVQSQNKPSESVVIGLEQQSDSPRDSTQTVKVLSGNKAHIHTGQAFTLGVFGNAMVTSGFYINPVLNGEHVLLTINAQDDTSRSIQRYNTASAQTTITVPLNKWIDLGSTDIQQSHQDRILFLESKQNKQQHYHIWMKIQLEN